MSEESSMYSIVLDDLLDSVDMIGKTAADVGIPHEAIDRESEYIITAYVEGRIIGKEDYGTIYFDRADDDFMVKSLWLHIKETSFDECIAQLAAFFGEAIEEGTEPYAEVNGGSVEWALYRHGERMIRLSSASERSYRELHIE